MSRNQKISIFSPLLLIGVMYPTFHVLAVVFGENWRIAWYIGLIIYWLIWGGIFPWLMIGRYNIKRIVKPLNLNPKVILLVLFPILMAGLFRVISGIEYTKPNLWIFLLLLSTAFGNGFFEEVLWRGVYMQLFPRGIFLRIVWPSIWFALWHYVPGSIAPSGNVMGLIIGSGLMGFYLSWLAKKTGTIFWGIIVHVVGGFVMIV
jgi:membrane protease YdiL (CAAX protease family)